VSSRKPPPGGRTTPSSRSRLATDHLAYVYLYSGRWSPVARVCCRGRSLRWISRDTLSRYYVMCKRCVCYARGSTRPYRPNTTRRAASPPGSRRASRSPRTSIKLARIPSYRVCILLAGAPWYCRVCYAYGRSRRFAAGVSGLFKYPTGVAVARVSSARCRGYGRQRPRAARFRCRVGIAVRRPTNAD
jgi:hypothetical protein